MAEGHDGRDKDLPWNEDLQSEEENDELNLSNASSSSDHGIDKKKRRTQTPSPQGRQMPFMGVPASPPKFMSLEKIMEAAAGVKNMSLAHEIAVNSDFKIEKLEQPSNSIEKQVTDIMHKAFWDAFEANMNENPPCYSQAVSLIGEVKGNLLSLLLPQHVRLKAQISEVMDIDLIKQKLENDAFDIFYYSDYVISIMAKLCSQARDEGVAKLKELKDVVTLFKEIFAMLDLMKMDMANFTIQQIRPYLQQQSVEYERKKFLEFLKIQQDNGVDGLELTKEWLKRGYESVKSDTECTDGATSNTITPASIVNEAYLEILVWDERRLFPETLVMDQARFLDAKHKTSKLTLIASILLVTYSTVGGAIAGVQALKEKLKSEICTLLDASNSSEEVSDDKVTGVALQINKTVNEYLTTHGFIARDEEQQKMLTGQITELAKKEHAVYKLMAKRQHDFMKQIISKRHTEPIKVPPGFSVIERELAQVCGQFLRLISHNRSVFFVYYSDIVNSLLQWKTEDLSPRD